MSAKFNSAGNDTERKAAKGSADSELNIQELLKKYLPEYADEETAPLQKETPDPEEFTDTPAEEPVLTEIPFTMEEISETPVEEPEKKSGLFARFVRPAAEEVFAEEETEEEDETVLPDLAIFEELSAVQAEEPYADPYADEEFSRELSAEVSGEPVAAAETDGEETFAEADPVIDETDINLMVAFGLEEQLEETIGAEAAEEVTARMEAASQLPEETRTEPEEYEYTDRSQTGQIAEAYKFALKTQKIKMIVAAVLTALLFFFENITLFGVQFAGALDPAVYPVVHIMVSLQILLFVLAVAYEQIITGFTNLFTLRPTPESVLSVLSVFAVAYSIVLACTVTPGAEPVLFNFPIAVTALTSLIFTYFQTKREVFSFNVVSSKRPKYVFRQIMPEEGTVESRVFGATDPDSPMVLRMNRTDFVDGYFARSSAVLHTTRMYVGAMLIGVAAASVLMAVFAAVGGSGARDAVTVAYLSFIGAMPLSMFFTYSYPFYKANREAYEYDSTIVGETSLEDYAGSSIVSFDDRNVFPSVGVKVQNIKIYNNNRIDRVLYYAASAFAMAGGPLSDVFHLATMEMERSRDVELLSAGVGYLETAVDGRQILFGRSSVLTELGYDIPVDVVEEDSYVRGDLSILYMLRDGNLVAKMFVRYDIDADFEFILKKFSKGGTSVCVKTFDPNIDEEMIASKIRGRRYSLKVVRTMDGCEDLERVDSGIVTRGSAKSLLQILPLCDMVLGVRNTNAVISVVSAIVSLAAVFIVTISQNLGALSSWMVVVSQLFWMLPAMMTAKMFIK